MTVLTHGRDLLPRSETVSPDTNQQMSVVLVIPVHSPVHGRFETVDRDRVLFKILHPSEVLNDSLELVVSCNDCLRVDSRHRLEPEQNGLLAQ